MRRTVLSSAAVMIAACLTAAACSSSGKGASSNNGSSASSASPTSAGVKATGTPITVGFVNYPQDASGNGQPDGLPGAKAAVNYVNNVLGGVGGHPIQLTSCDVSNADASGTTCGNTLASANPVIVLNSVNAVANDYLPILAKAGIPYLSADPVSSDELIGDNAFVTSGGIASAGASFALYALNTLHAKKVSVAYVDLPAAQIAAQNFIQKPLEAKGVSVALHSVPVTAPDMTPIISAIEGQNPQLAFMLAPNPQCLGTMKALASVPANFPFFYAGNCADTSILKSGGSGANGGLFALIPGVVPIPGDSDYTAYTTEMKKDFPNTSVSGAAVESFADVMNAYSVMKGISGDISAASVMAALKSASGVHLWFGEGATFTCDGKQFPGLKSVCATYTVIGKNENGTLSSVQKINSVASLYGA